MTGRELFEFPILTQIANFRTQIIRRANLLVAQGLYRVQPHGPASGNVASQQGDGAQNERDDQKSERIGGRHAEKQTRDQPGYCKRERDADG